MSPTSPGQTTTISAAVSPAVGGLCGGLSPCDGYDYRGDGSTGNPGTFFLPELVDNHKPFPGTFLPGLEDFLSVAICDVSTSPDPDPYPDPTTSDCVPPAGRQPGAFAPEVDFYKTQWNPPSQNSPGGRANEGKTFRIHVLLAGELLLAFRDVRLTDPSATQPADNPNLDVRNGSNVNIKVAVTDASGFQVGNCTAADDAVQTDPPEEITCIIPAGTQGSVSMLTTAGTVVANFAENFPLLIEADAACEDIDTDLALYGPCVEMAAPSVTQALQNSQIFFCDEFDNPLGGAPAGTFVLQQSTAAGIAGTQALPAVDCGDPLAASGVRDGFFGLVTGGVEKVARLFQPRDLIATSAVGHSGGGGALSKFGSKFQLAYGAYLGQPELPAVVQEDESIEVVVPVVGADGTRVYLFSTQSGGAVGDIACPDPSALGAGEACEQGVGPYSAVKFTTGSASVAKAVWTPSPSTSPVAGGTEVELRMLGAGIGVAGSDAVDAGDGIAGTLIPFDRNPFGTDGAHNGPILGVVDAFEPNPHELAAGGKPVALNDRAQVSTVLVCGEGVAPQSIDGVKDEAWACAGDEKYSFIANLSGPKPKADNAFVYAMDDGTDVYFGLEIRGTNEIADLFINFSQTGTDGSAEAGDDLILLREDGTADMYTTGDCANSQGKSLCGADDPNPTLEAAADDNGDFIFYEFKKPRCSNETVMIDGAPLDVDFCLDSVDDLWAYVTLTGGKGGGKGSTIAKGFREWTLIFGDGTSP